MWCSICAMQTALHSSTDSNMPAELPFRQAPVHKIYSLFGPNTCVGDQDTDRSVLLFPPGMIVSQLSLHGDEISTLTSSKVSPSPRYSYAHSEA